MEPGFGAWLQRRIGTQDEFAKKVGVSRELVSRWGGRDREPPNLHHLAAIARALDLDEAGRETMCQAWVRSFAAWNVERKFGRLGVIDDPLAAELASVIRRLTRSSPGSMPRHAPAANNVRLRPSVLGHRLPSDQGAPVGDRSLAPAAVGIAEDSATTVEPERTGDQAAGGELHVPDPWRGLLGLEGDVSPEKIRTILPHLRGLTHQGEALTAIALSTRLIEQVERSDWAVDAAATELVPQLYYERAFGRIEALKPIDYGAVVDDVKLARKILDNRRRSALLNRDLWNLLERRGDLVLGVATRIVEDELQARPSGWLRRVLARCVDECGEEAHPLDLAWETDDRVDEVWCYTEQIKRYTREGRPWLAIEAQFAKAEKALADPAFRAGPAALLLPFLVYEARGRALIRLADAPPGETDDTLAEAAKRVNLRTSRFQLDLTACEAMLLSGDHLTGGDVLNSLQRAAPSEYQQSKVQRLGERFGVA